MCRKLDERKNTQRIYRLSANSKEALDSPRLVKFPAFVINRHPFTKIGVRKQHIAIHGKNLVFWYPATKIFSKKRSIGGKKKEHRG